MSQSAQRRSLLHLIRKYLNGTASEQEKVFIEKYYAYFDRGASQQQDLSGRERQALEERMLEKIHGAIHPADKPMAHLGRKRYIRVAAALFAGLIGGGIFYFYPKHPPSVAEPAVTVQGDILPGTHGAVLKLANGKVIVLDTARSGRLVNQAGHIISKTDSTLEVSSTGVAGKVEYYTLTTPRARREQLLLADGTRVWLNAGSSIRFPNAFPGAVRSVEVTGEAYFEVAKKAGQPFVVSVDEVKIDVLGTEFNVMAYRDERRIKTTLLEGAVRVTSGTDALLLKPGQEAWIESKDRMHLVRKANLNEAVAWKNNLFWFEKDDVRTVMNSLSRWYDVDIVIKGNIPDLFTGSMPRDLTFSKVFEVLQKTGGIHYKIEEGKVIVTP